MRILFQGDSITDACRDRSDYHNLGGGYPRFSAELIKERHPDTDFEFINLGISGDRVEPLFGRFSRDCINLKPDIVSILIGINDTWHQAGQDSGWMDNDKFEFFYRACLERIKKETDAKIIMLEQFLLYVPDKDFWHVDLDPKIGITRKLAREYADVFIPLDGLFASLSVDRPSTDWAGDGVHPSEIGHKYIAGLYADAVDRLMAE